MPLDSNFGFSQAAYIIFKQYDTEYYVMLCVGESLQGHDFPWRRGEIKPRIPPGITKLISFPNMSLLSLRNSYRRNSTTGIPEVRRKSLSSRVLAILRVRSRRKFDRFKMSKNAKYMVVKSLSILLNSERNQVFRQPNTTIL